MVPVTGLDLHFLSHRERKLWSQLRPAEAEQQSTGLLQLDGFESYPYMQKIPAPNGVGIFWCR